MLHFHLVPWSTKVTNGLMYALQILHLTITSGLTTGTSAFLFNKFSIKVFLYKKINIYKLIT